jgi:hypothetical protein
MVPGTDELVRKYPQQGAQLFRKHGFHIPHPRYRDYYNGMQTGGFGFFQDLGALLGGIAGHLGSSPARQAQLGGLNTNANVPGLGNETSQSIAALGAGNNPGAGDIPAYTIPFTGDEYSNAIGNDPAPHIYAYNELLNHLHNEAQRERVLEERGVPFYSAVEYVPMGLLPGAPSATGPMDIGGHKPGLSTNKKLLIIGLIVFALWYHFKGK